MWTVNGFSAHADQPILLDWVKKAAPERLFLVHGEEEALEAFKQAISKELAMNALIAPWRRPMEA